jgi:hypothetical protein
MNTMPCYQFDASGWLVGSTEADESPLEPGVFHLPAGCTFTAPPKKCAAGNHPRWDGRHWHSTKRAAADE